MRLGRGKVGQAPRGRWKPGTAARPDTAVWNGAGYWLPCGCRRVTTATPEWLGRVERPMEAATRDAASVCFASASRAGGADRIQRNRRADAVACWWRIGSTGRSRIAHMESRYQSGKQKAVGGHVRQRASIHRRRRRGSLRSRATCSSRRACDRSSRQISMRQRAPVRVESSVSSGRDRSATVAPSLAPDGQERSIAKGRLRETCRRGTQSMSVLQPANVATIHAEGRPDNRYAPLHRSMCARISRRYSPRPRCRMWLPGNQCIVLPGQ